MVDMCNDCFEDSHILQPNWETIEKIKDKVIIYLLIHEEDAWGKLERHAKYKYKKRSKIYSKLI